MNVSGAVRWQVLVGGMLLLGAIALLPGFLSCHNRKPGFTGCVDHGANLSFSGRRGLPGMLRAQQAYYQEHQRLATSVADLADYAATEGQSPNFEYPTESRPPLFLVYSIPKQHRLPIRVEFQGLSWTEHYPVRAAVMAIAPPITAGALPIGLVCENREAGMAPPAPPVLKDGTLACADSTRPVDP